MPGCERIKVCLQVNRVAVDVDVDAGELLVDTLRDRLSLAGTRIGCRTGDCGACTVLVDGSARKSCLLLSTRAHGCEVTTIEGLGGGDRALHALQTAFWQENGFQCGFCTSGMILTAVDLLGRDPAPTESVIRDAISGNLCRCTGYESIVTAIDRAARELQG